MDYVPILEEQAKQRGLTFSPLSNLLTLSQSDKIACCGGSVVRVVTESSSDSTVAIQDSPNSLCYCAIHGDVTSRYPDVLTPGALLLFTNVTVLILSSAVTPLLIVCTENVAGLALPQETYPHSGGASARASGFTAPAPPPKPDQAVAVATHGTQGGRVGAVPLAEPVVPRVAQPRPRESSREHSQAPAATVADTSSEDEDGLELVDDL